MVVLLPLLHNRLCQLSLSRDSNGDGNNSPICSSIAFDLHAQIRSFLSFLEKSQANNKTMSGLGGTTCQRCLPNAASFVLCVRGHVKDHHNSLQSWPRLKKTCVRHLVLDKWLPLSGSGSLFHSGAISAAIIITIDIINIITCVDKL